MARAVRTIVIVVALVAGGLYLQYRGAGVEAPEYLRACEDWNLVAVSGRDDQRLREAMLCLHNVERRRRGLPELRHDDRLQRAADAHAEDMVDSGFFEHVNLDGVRPAQRMRRSGYRGRLMAENLALGEGDRGAPASMFDDWMHSPGHRANIVHPRLREIGIGIAHAGSRVYYVANLGARR